MWLRAVCVSDGFLCPKFSYFCMIVEYLIGASIKSLKYVDIGFETVQSLFIFLGIIKYISPPFKNKSRPNFWA